MYIVYRYNRKRTSKDLQRYTRYDTIETVEKQSGVIPERPNTTMFTLRQTRYNKSTEQFCNGNRYINPDAKANQYRDRSHQEQPRDLMDARLGVYFNNSVYGMTRGEKPMPRKIFSKSQAWGVSF